MSGNNKDIATLIEVMQRLRDPQSGCPWDVAQDFNTIAPYTIEEAYEVADAIARNEMGELRDELGDLLFQVVFHARIAEEQNEFAFADVVGAIVEKMIRRHPHVFADAQAGDAQTQTLIWEEIKALERAHQGRENADPMADIPLGLVALQRAAKIQNRAARLGFDWDEVPPVIMKLREEIEELELEIARDATRDRIGEELGDVLFSVVNLARHLQIDPAGALIGANARFVQRFEHVCEQAGGAQQLKSHAQEQLETLWQQAKRELDSRSRANNQAK
jgi:ATP diphosphatase